MRDSEPVYESLMKKRSRLGLSPGYRRMIESLAATLIISLLVAYAIPRYMTCKSKAFLITFSGQTEKMRMGQLYHAFTGEWPESDGDLQHSNLAGLVLTPTDDTFIDRVSVENGAFHFTYKKGLAGKTLTLRPAVPAEDPLGPEIFVAGDTLKKGWSLTGPDRTDVDPSLIGSYLK
jgi:type II secretory pathway pseudopilin PulG